MNNVKLDGYFAKKREETQALPINIQKSHVIDMETASILVHIPGVYNSRINEDSIASAIEKATEGVRYCSNSLHKATKTGDLYRLFVKKQRSVISMEEANAAGFTQVNDTVFQDEHDNIWTVNTDADTAYLVSTIDEDIGSLINSVSIRSLATASVNVGMEEDYSRGNIVHYYDAAEEAMSTGIAIDGARIYDVEKEEVKHVEAAFAVCVAEQSLDIEESAMASSDKKAFIDYMKRLYGHNKEFFNQIKMMINKSVAV
jgi:hypothetical protein